MLGLACIDNAKDKDGFRDVHVLMTFQWGFSVQVDPAQAIIQSVPVGWGAPSDAFLKTLNNFYDGEDAPGTVQATSLYKFDTNVAGCFLATPEPSTLTLLVGSCWEWYCSKKA